MLANNIKNQIISRIKQKNLSVPELEKKANLNKGTTNHILYNKSLNPKIETLNAIAKALECKVDDLLQDVNNAITSEDEENCELIQTLLSETMQKAFAIFNSKKLVPNLKTALFIIKKVYIFSLTKKNKKLDLEFLEWIIDNNIKPG